MSMKTMGYKLYMIALVEYYAHYKFNFNDSFFEMELDCHFQNKYQMFWNEFTKLLTLIQEYEELTYSWGNEIGSLI